MGIHINTTVSPSILTSTTKQLQQSMERMASGKRINSASDDAAGNSIAARITSNIMGFNASIRNVNDGISFAQVGSSALGGVQDSLQRIRELSVQAANGILSDNDRASIQAEVSALKDQITSVFDQTSFNGRKLLSTDDTIEFQVGANSGQTVSTSTSDLNALFTSSGFDTLDVSTAAGASAAISVIDDVIETTTEAQTSFGSLQNRFMSTYNSLETAKISAESARSQILDTDYAKESSILASNQLQQKAAIAMLAQANANKSVFLQLLK